MSDRLPHREYCPTVCLGYGASGHAWLRHVATDAQRVPMLRELVRLGLLQYWAVNSQVAECDGWWSLSADEHPDALLGQLERGRRDELRHEVPGLAFHRVQVLERVSLYDASSMARGRLYDQLNVARAHAADQGAGARAPANAFSFHWLSFVDGTWPSGMPDLDGQQQAADMVRGFQSDRILYVDRASAARGVVSCEDADQVLASLAVATLSSDLGFARQSAGDAGRSQVMGTSAQPGFVTPIGILTVVHSPDQYLRLRAKALLRLIVRGPADGALDELMATLGSVPAPDKALQNELYSPSAVEHAWASRDRRSEAIVAAVARALATRSPKEGVTEVTRLRTALQHYRRSVQSALTSAGMPVMLATTIGNRVAILALAVAAVALIAWTWLRWRAATSLGQRQSSDPMPVHPSTASERALSDWDRIADVLSAVYVAFDSALEDWNDGRVVPSTRGWQRGAYPYHWEYGGDGPFDAQEKATSWVYSTLGEEVAREVFRSAGSTAPSEVLTAALRAVAEREQIELGRQPQALLSALLALPHGDALRDVVRQAPSLAQVIGEGNPREIAWLMPRDAEHGDYLVRMESAQLYPYARTLVSEDRMQSIRVIFGEDVPWASIVSLGFLNSFTPGR